MKLATNENYIHIEIKIRLGECTKRKCENFVHFTRKTWRDETTWKNGIHRRV